MSGIDTAAVDSLKALDPKRPIREADISGRSAEVCYVPISAAIGGFVELVRP